MTLLLHGLFFVNFTVETPRGTSCGDPVSGRLHASLPGPGYIANLVTEATACGSVHSPWHIEAQPGQTIHLSLMDFTLEPPSRRRCLDPAFATTPPPRGQYSALHAIGLLLGRISLAVQTILTSHTHLSLALFVCLSSVTFVHSA